MMTDSSRRLKVCVDCKWINPNATTMCTHPSLWEDSKKLSLVTGEYAGCRTAHCATRRSNRRAPKGVNVLVHWLAQWIDRDKCGPKGKQWEPKETGDG